MNDSLDGSKPTLLGNEKGVPHVVVCFHFRTEAGGEFFVVVEVLVVTRPAPCAWWGYSLACGQLWLFCFHLTLCMRYFFFLDMNLAEHGYRPEP